MPKGIVNAKKRRKKRRATDKGTVARRVRARAESCEVATEQDGFLRGKADPCFVVALLAVPEIGRASVLSRAIARARISDVPGIASITPALELASAVRGVRIALLGFALEEDGGTDVAKLYAALEDLGRFRFWLDAVVPSPVGIDDLVRAMGETANERAEVLVDERSFVDECRDDAFVGARVAVLAPSHGAHAVRLRFASVGMTNDWTLRMDVQFS